MTREELDRLWARPENWSSVYRCEEDPRVIVPRRRQWMGWTINFAHRLAWPVMIALVGVPLGIVLIVTLATAR